MDTTTWPTVLTTAPDAGDFLADLWVQCAVRDRVMDDPERLLATFLGHSGLSTTDQATRHPLGAFVPFSGRTGLPGGYLASDTDLPPVLRLCTGVPGMRKSAFQRLGKAGLAGPSVAPFLDPADLLSHDQTEPDGPLVTWKTALPAAKDERAAIGVLDASSWLPHTPVGTHHAATAVLAARDVADALDQVADNTGVSLARMARAEATALRTYADQVEPLVATTSAPWLAVLAPYAPFTRPTNLPEPTATALRLRAETVAT